MLYFIKEPLFVKATRTVRSIRRSMSAFSTTPLAEVTHASF